MKARRWISGIALVATLLAQTVPAQAGRMLCGMKEKPRVESCSRCDRSGAATTGTALRASSCCRTSPSTAAEAAPVVLSTPRAKTGAVDGCSPTLTSAPALLAGVPAEPLRVTSLGFEAPRIADLSARTTVLRN